MTGAFEQNYELEPASVKQNVSIVSDGHVKSVSHEKNGDEDDLESILSLKPEKLELDDDLDDDNQFSD